MGVVYRKRGVSGKLAKRIIVGAYNNPLRKLMLSSSQKESRSSTLPQSGEGTVVVRAAIRFLPQAGLTFTHKSE
jgi:hypothetical protein